MERQTGIDKRRKVAISAVKAIGITVLAFLLALIMVNPLSFSAMSIFSSPEKDDFTISDLYAQVSDRRPVRVIEQDVVMVDVGSLNRQEISEVFSTLSLCGCRAIGVDIIFEEPLIMGEEADSLLLGSINEMKSVSPVIFPIEVESIGDSKYKIKQRPFFYDKIPGLHYGAANLPSKSKGGVIREFAVNYDPFESFPVAVADCASPKSVERLKGRYTQLEMIDYASREYKVIKADELLSRGEELVDKTVLVGSMDDISDQHATPIKSYNPGLYIQACAVSTILGGRYFTGFGKVWNWGAASLLCYLVTLLGFLVNAKIKGLVVRILQLVLVYIAVQIGYSLFVDHRIIINITYTLLMVTFGLFATDIWNGVEGIIGMVRDRRKSVNKNII